MSATKLVLSLNDHPNPSRGREKGFGKVNISKIVKCHYIAKAIMGLSGEGGGGLGYAGSLPD